MGETIRQNALRIGRLGSLLRVGIAVLALTASAQAGTLEVEFDFTGSSVAILGGFIQLPPDGSIVSGNATLQVEAASAAAPGPGFAQLRSFTLAGTFAKNSLGVSITGALNGTQSGASNGGLTAGLGVVNLPTPFILSFTGFANCVGTGCGALSLPAGLTGIQTFTIGALPVGSLANVGNATLNGTFSFTLAGFTAVLSLVGAEIDRTFIVPEPNTFGLVALGLGTLALHATRRRLRR